MNKLIWRIIMKDIPKMFLEYISMDPLWIFCVFIMLIDGIMIMHLIYKKRTKINKLIKMKLIGKIMPLAIGVLFTVFIFVIQNFKVIIYSEMTLELMHDRILSSTLISCAITCVTCLVVLPIRERRKIKKEEGK